MISVRMTDEVLTYLQYLPPQPRHALKRAIKGLANEQGDIRPLSDELEDFHRLRVGSHRVIFEYEMIGGTRTITCVFAGRRKWFTKSSKAASGKTRHKITPGGARVRHGSINFQMC